MNPHLSKDQLVEMAMEEEAAGHDPEELGMDQSSFPSLVEGHSVRVLLGWTALKELKGNNTFWITGASTGPSYLVTINSSQCPHKHRTIARPNTQDTPQVDDSPCPYYCPCMQSNARIESTYATKWYLHVDLPPNVVRRRPQGSGNRVTLQQLSNVTAAPWELEELRQRASSSSIPQGMERRGFSKQTYAEQEQHYCESDLEDIEERRHYDWEEEEDGDDDQPLRMSPLPDECGIVSPPMPFQWLTSRETKSSGPRDFSFHPEFGPTRAWTPGFHPGDPSSSSSSANLLPSSSRGKRRRDMEDAE